VRHLATGGELVDPSPTPGPGQIRDTNTHLLRALFSELGVRDFQTSRIADDPDATAEAAETEADLLILSGGASVGDYDFGAAALRKLGYQIHFDRVNLRPGKPLTFATRGAQAAFVIPGNPVSHYVCFHAAVRLAVECFTARPATWPAVWVPLAEGATLTPDPRDTWWPARVRAAEGQLTVTPKRWSSSGDTFSLAGTNALVLVNPDSPWQGRALTLLLEAPAC
jgi:molybdopterin molybdotransferase